MCGFGEGGLEWQLNQVRGAGWVVKREIEHVPLLDTFPQR